MSHVDRITGLWSLQQHTCQWVLRLDFELSMTGNTNYKQMLGVDTSIFTVTKINLLVDKLHWLTTMTVARVEVQSSAKWSTKAILSKWNTIYDDYSQQTSSNPKKRMPSLVPGLWPSHNTLWTTQE